MFFGIRKDLLSIAILFSITGLVCIVYYLRIFLKGSVHFDRIEKQGGSFLLSKSIMEMAYWFFQPLARALLFFHISANQISWAALALGIIAGSCLCFGHFGFAAIFASFSAIMDSLDGIVARMSGVESNAGEVLDATIDRYVEFFFFAGLAVYYHENLIFFILVLTAMMGSFMVSYSSAIAEALHVKPPKGSMRRPERTVYLTLGSALSPLTIQWFEMDRDYPIATAHPMIIALCLVAVIGNFSAIERLYTIAKETHLKEKEKISHKTNAESAIPITTPTGTTRRSEPSR